MKFKFVIPKKDGSSSKKGLLFAILAAGIFLLYSFVRDMRYGAVKEAISLEKALSLAQKPNYHLLEVQKPVGFKEFRFFVGKNGEQGEYAELHPFLGDSLGHVLTPQGSLFLIRAQRCEKLPQGFCSKQYAANEIRYRIFVEDWEIVEPIHRDYEYQDHGRWFYPKGYIDEYDLLYGDYIPEEENQARAAPEYGATHRGRGIENGHSIQF